MTQSLRKCITRRALIHTKLVSNKIQIIAIFLTCLYFNTQRNRLYRSFGVRTGVGVCCNNLINKKMKMNMMKVHINSKACVRLINL